MLNIDTFMTPTEHTAVDHSDITGVRTIQIEFGGDQVAPGDYYSPSGNPQSAPIAGPGYPPALADHPIAFPVPSLVFSYAWSLSVAGATFQLYVNGATAGPGGLLIPAGPIGGAPLPGPVVVTLGDIVGLQFVSGPAPGPSSLTFFIQG